jgi:4-amino-4-deoxy-L-arabinose transferase-like glycosyltransferase
MVRIDQPYIDRWSWRQSDVAAIARNYFQNGYRFLYPQIDWAGNEPGYVGTEFPILPFAAAMVYQFAGVHEWIGRGETVLLFAFGLPFFYLLVRDLLGRETALGALIFYSFAPLSVATSRSFMPDMPSLSLAMAGAWLFLRWLENRRLSWLVSSGSALSLAILIKAPTAILGAPLLFLCLSAPTSAPRLKAAAWLRDARLWLFATIALAPAGLWYWHAARLATAFYPHHMFGAGGFEVRDLQWYARIAKLTASSSLTLSLTAFAIVGAFVQMPRRGRWFFAWWTVAMVAFVILAGYGNRHPWYQLPFVPIAAACAGAGCARLRPRLPRIVIGAIVALFLSNAALVTPKFFEPAAAQLRDLGLQLRAITPAHALIVAADDGDPTIFYYAERKGWHFLENHGVFYGNPLDDAQLIAGLEQLRRRGATHLVFPFATRWWLDYYRTFAGHLARTSSVVQSNERSAIFELHRPE